MSEGHNRGKTVFVELTVAQAEFVIKNAETNMAFGLGSIQTVSRETAEKLVEQIESFKGVLAAVKKAMP